MSFRVCTYNMGSDDIDYTALCQYSDPETAKDPQVLQKRYQIAQLEVANRLKDQAEVFCLQEVVELDRPLIKVLKEKNYQMFKIGRQFFGCMIALHPDFEILENHSTTLEGGDLALVVTTHKPTRQPFAFISAHVPGCPLEGLLQKEDTAIGDKYCQQIAEKIQSIASSIPLIVGADMNANPEKWLPRFIKFSENGFQILRTHSPTNVFPKSPAYKERELDFILVKFPPSPFRAMSMFYKAKEIKATISNSQPLGWRTDTNASDHLPVFANISL